MASDIVLRPDAVLPASATAEQMARFGRTASSAAGHVRELADLELSVAYYRELSARAPELVRLRLDREQELADLRHAAERSRLQADRAEHDARARRAEREAQPVAPSPAPSGPVPTSRSRAAGSQPSPVPAPDQGRDYDDLKRALDRITDIRARR